MSYELYYHGEEGVVKVPPHVDGGTVKFVITDDGSCIYPGDDAELNITYNYSSIFPFRELNGKVGEDVLDELEDKDRYLICSDRRTDEQPGEKNRNIPHKISCVRFWLESLSDNFF